MCRSQGTQNINYLLVAEATTILTPAATFLVFSIVAVVGNSTTLLTNQAFTSLAVLALLGAPLASMIQAVPDLLAAVACFRRIQVFLDLSEHIDRRHLLQCSVIVSDKGPVVSNVDGMELETVDSFRGPSLHPLIELSAVTVTGVPETSLILENINFAARRSHLLAITGPVGSGKTTLLQTILGEIVVASGLVATTTRSIAFCVQTTWLQDGSLREKILFGEPYHTEWYSEVIRACALVHDIANLSLGDATEVGNKGDKLSGGQRQRIVSGQTRVLPFDTDQNLRPLHALCTQKHI
jgi:ATP-binding cassette subfamily C (CFTR/MRP) protein 1